MRPATCRRRAPCPRRRGPFRTPTIHSGPWWPVPGPPARAPRLHRTFASRASDAGTRGKQAFPGTPRGCCPLRTGHGTRRGCADPATCRRRGTRVASTETQNRSLAGPPGPPPADGSPGCVAVAGAPPLRSEKRRDGRRSRACCDLFFRFSLLTNLKACKDFEVDNHIKDFAAKLSLIPSPPPGPLHLVILTLFLCERPGSLRGRGRR